jgi:hypothetical protein
MVVAIYLLGNLVSVACVRLTRAGAYYNCVIDLTKHPPRSYLPLSLSLVQIHQISMPGQNFPVPLLLLFTLAAGRAGRRVRDRTGAAY